MIRNELIEQLKKPRRNLGFLKVEFNITDPDTNPNITTNNEEVFSDFQNIKEEEIVQTKNYATLEKNFWLLDGSQPIYGSEELDQTYISSFMSDENGILIDKPSFTMLSDVYLTTLGLTMTFDSINQNYVSKVNIKGYRDDEIIVDKDYSISKFRDRVIFADNEELFRWNKLVITFLETNLPYRRVRVNQLLFGILEVYTNESIINASSKEKTIMINSELPIHTFKFSIDNMNKLFNPDNPTGWYRYILQKQPITYTWGYQLDNGTFEWFLGGNMLLTGSVNVGNNQVTFDTTSLINHLTKIYKKGTYNLLGRSLYDLALDVLTDNEVKPEQYDIWDGLKLIKTDASLPKIEARQLLQIIATSGNCTLFTDRDNIIHIQPFFNSLNVDNMDYSVMTSKPIVTVQSELYNSIVYINHYSVESQISELFKNEELEIIGTKIIEIEYELATNIEVEITGGNIINSNIYGAYAILEIENTSNSTISLIIKGNKVLKTQTLDIKNYNIEGSNIEYSNELITPMLENAKQIKLKEFIGNWYNNRNIYKFKNRGEVLKDTNGLVNIQTEFTDKIKGYLVENNINYNGAWSGDSVVIKVSDKNVD